MGLIVSRFRKSKNAEQVLEQLQKEIDTIEHRLQYSFQRQKIIVGKFVIYSIVMYLLVAAISYFYLFPSTWKGRALVCVPLFGIPFIIFYGKQFVSWIYKRDITRSKDKLSDLLSKKKKTLEDVMNTETYKKAKDILDKYAPEQTRKQSPILQPLAQPRTPVQVKQPSNQLAQTVTKLPGPGGPPPMQRRSPSPTQSPMLLQRQQMPKMLVRPIFPPERGFLDRVVESLIGDGPNNRYALICQHCASHNGMALKEEFEFLAFKCVYCGYPNPSRKVRPRLSLGGGPQFQRRALFPPGSDGSPPRPAIEESGSSSDTESGVKIEEVIDDPPAPSSEEPSKIEEETKQPIEITSKDLRSAETVEEVETVESHLPPPQPDEEVVE